jgi:hypothetical protein
MQPDFALSLSFEGIALLRRTGDAWAEIDSVFLDTDDLDAAVTGLRHRAEALDPDGAKVSLVIPNEQIRYLDMPDLGCDPSSRKAAILGALDGATPYAVEELVHDHSLSNQRLLIAAVARETLGEAQAFAENYGFKPVSYVARAEVGAFNGAVFFGPVPSWKGAKPTRPASSLRIVPADAAALAPKVSAPEPVIEEPVAAEPEAVPAAPVAPVVAPPVDEPTVAAPDAAPVLQYEDTAAPDAALAPQSEAPAAPMAETASHDLPTDLVDCVALETGADADPGVVAQDTPEASPQVRFASIRAQRGESSAPVAAPPVAAPKSISEDVGRRITPVPTAPNPAREAGVTSQSIDADAPEDTKGTNTAAGAATAAVRFLSNRLSRKPAADAKAKDTAPAKVAKDPAVKRKAKPPKLAAPKVGKAGPAPARLIPSLPKATSAPAGDPVPPVAARSFEPTAPAPKPAERKRGPFAAMAAKRSAQSAAAGAAVMTMDAERERMTVFGARNREQIGGKPRFLGLLLTTVLLLFLAAVAAWASVFLDDGLASLFRRDEEPTAIAAAPELPAAPIEPAAESGPAIAATAPLRLPDAPTQPVLAPDSTSSEDDVQLAALDTAPSTTDAPPALAVPLVPQALTPQEAAATYAATGIWQRAPTAPHLPPTDGVEDIYVASIDPAVQESDAVALPTARGFDQDAAIADPGLPPPSDLQFEFDDRNLIRATPEGALTPDGLRIYTGPPPVTPPLRGVRPEAPRLDDQQTAALAAVRPAVRPEDLVEQRERATLGGSSRAELAALRPVMRPKTVQEQEVEDEPEATATERAVAKSLTPLPRPRNMERIVREAETKREEEPVQVASVAPRTVQPSIPSSTSVAKAATVRNAINLRQINLIGVYGTSSNRRALVRLPSGGYRKVKVGDRLDGGRVAAIGDSELRYTKGGRNVTLKMPR